MSTQTTNLKLIKPEMSDYANITDISNNFDILDKAYGDLNSAHADIMAKITSDINAHNSSGTSHADIRRMFNNYLPLTGGTMTGNINSSNATGLSLQGATSRANGAAIELRAKTDTSNYKGCLILDANLNSDQNRLIIKPNGVITCNRNVTLQAKDGTGLYAKTDGSCGISNGTTKFEFGRDNNFYFNGGRIAKIFNLDYSDIKKFDVAGKPNMSYLEQGEYSLQLFQDKQSLWTEMYVLVWNTTGNRWLKFKSPISWRNQEGTFIVTSVGRVIGQDNHGDNTCTWIDNNTFYMYSQGNLYQMYHFAGYASAIFGEMTADLFEIDETTEKMTVQTNARAELQSINNKLQDLQAAAVSATSIEGEDTYTIYKDGQVVEMNYEQLNNYHDTLTDRRAELLDILKV